MKTSNKKTEELDFMNPSVIEKITDVELEGFDLGEHPGDACPHLHSAKYDGRDLTDKECKRLEMQRGDFIQKEYEKFYF